MFTLAWHIRIDQPPLSMNDDMSHMYCCVFANGGLWLAGLGI
jgi:hypothetical protein